MSGVRSILGVSSLLTLIIISSPILAEDKQAPTTRPTSKPSKKAKRSPFPPLGAPAGVFGAGVQLKKPMRLADAAKQLDKLKNKVIRLDGQIMDVCKKKGCWMVFRDGKVQLRVKFKGYKFFVPRDAHKRRAIVQGVLSAKTISEAMAKHYAEESGNPEAAKKIKGPQKVLAFMATGVEILAKPTLPPVAKPKGQDGYGKLHARIKQGKQVHKLPLAIKNLRHALLKLRTLPGARTQEFSVCAEFELHWRWMVFSDAKGKAFAHGYAVREDGEVRRF